MNRTGNRFGRGSAIVVSVAMATCLAACGNSQNEHRLSIIRADPVLRCRVHGMHLTSASNVAGSRDGIGFGGNTATGVSRRYRLQGEFQPTADRLSACASAAGWAASSNPVSEPNFLVIDGHKRIDNEWDATLTIYVGHDAERNPSVLVTIDTEPV